MLKPKSVLISPQFFAGASEFSRWLQRQAESSRIYAVDPKSRLRLFPPEQILSLAFNPSRSLDPIKSLFLPGRACLGPVFAPDSSPDPEIPRRIILGLKSCDLRALALMDAVFLGGEIADDDYQIRRDRAIIISSDCTKPTDYCFCLALGGSLYPEDGFDLNLSPVREGWVIAVGSGKGQQLMIAAGFRAAEEREYDGKISLRREVEQNFSSWLKRQGLDLREADLKKNIETRREDPTWQELAQKCVECGACSFICPTCHCFQLSDRQEGETCVRFRNWDSCQYQNFARIAGGANPLSRRRQRLWNRYEKKFSFFMIEFGRYACVGCGRCIEACAGGIDTREVLKELALG